MATLPKTLPSAFSQVESKPSRVARTKPRVAGVAKPESIAAAKAKAHFLQLLDRVERDRSPITITKRGRIVAQIVPAAPESKVSAFDQMFGRTKGWMTVTGDIVSPDHESWGPDWH